MDRDKESSSLVIGYIFLVCIGVTALLFAVFAFDSKFQFNKGNFLWPIKYSGTPISIFLVLGIWLVCCIIPSYSIYRHWKKKKLAYEALMGGAGVTPSGVAVDPTEPVFPYAGGYGADTVVGGGPVVEPLPGIEKPIEPISISSDGYAKAKKDEKSLKVSAKDKKKEAKPEVEKKVQVIYQYYDQRIETNWICPRCDVYNDQTSNTCQLCGALRR